jgi:hypothetical protein
MATVTKIKGFVQAVNARNTSAGTTYDVVVAGAKYGTWTNKPTCAEGDQVEFAATQNGQYWNVKGAIVILEKASARPAAAPQSAPEIPAYSAPAQRGVVQGDLGKDQYWKNKEDRDIAREKRQEVVQTHITYQASRNAAIAFVDLLLKNGAVPMAKDSKNKADAVEALVLEYTQAFYDDTFNLGRDREPAPALEDAPVNAPATSWK